MRIVDLINDRMVFQKGRRSLAASIILALFFSAGSLPQQDISEYQKRLSKLTQQIKEIKSRIKKEEKQESTILNTLDRIGLKKNLIKKEISVYDIQLDKANRELLSIKKSIPLLKEKLEKEKQSIETTLITLYKFGKFSTFRYMLKTEDLASLISESKNLSFLAQYQEKIISDYIETLSQLKSAESELGKKKKRFPASSRMPIRKGKNSKLKRERIKL